jgi:hypothetical protein
MTAPDSLPRLPGGKSLFSQHYLQTRLPDHPEWAEDPAPVFETVRALWERACALGASWNEAQTEEEFVRPVLDALVGVGLPRLPRSGTRGVQARDPFQTAR